MPAQSVRFPDLRYFVSQRRDAFLKGILRDDRGERNWGVTDLPYDTKESGCNTSVTLRYVRPERGALPQS